MSSLYYISCVRLRGNAFMFSVIMKVQHLLRMF